MTVTPAKLDMFVESTDRTTGLPGPLTIYTASRFFQRLRGLLGRRRLRCNEALHIKPCRDVHSFGMRYALDVVFLDSAGNVLDVVRLNPNRCVRHRNAVSVMEFNAGCAHLNGFHKGFKYVRYGNNSVRTEHIGERS